MLVGVSPRTDAGDRESARRMMKWGLVVRGAETFDVLPLTGGADRVSARLTTGEWILSPRGGR